jgi:hypothetical protein
MTTIPVVFDYPTWIAMFPELSGITEPAATGYFSFATVFIRNDGTYPVKDQTLLQNLLYLTTAHIARLLSNRTNGVPTTGGIETAPPIVGRINNASEGSVSVATEMPNQPPSAAWWNQTTYGAMVWRMLAPFRTMRYVPAPRRIYNPPFRTWYTGYR